METRQVVLTETVKYLKKYQDEINKRANVSPSKEFKAIGTKMKVAKKMPKESKLQVKAYASLRL